MTEISLTIQNSTVKRSWEFFDRIYWPKATVLIAILLSLASILYSWSHDYIIAYNDSESHLNIAKRVIANVTPGLAQLGGVWLPLPHLLMIPFVYFDPLWRSGLAGSIVSGISFVIAAIFVYKLTQRVVGDKWAAVVSFLVFVLNPNILYMQSTPLTELLLIVFFVVSIYAFVKFLESRDILQLVFAAFFGLAASLSRYDGWFLVAAEAGILLLQAVPWRSFVANIKQRSPTVLPFLTEVGEGRLVLFATLAFIGIGGWFLWDLLILGSPFYFADSIYSAKAQQQVYLARGDLITYHNLLLSFVYYLLAAMSNVGILAMIIALWATFKFFFDKTIPFRREILLLLMVPFIFYVVTLFMGQSIIFLPHLTQMFGMGWRIFNSRYGLMMVAPFAFLIGYPFKRSSITGRIVIIVFLLLNMTLYLVKYSPVITLADGTTGFSSHANPMVEAWAREHYDGGLVLIDDFARPISIIRSNFQMQNVIYVGSGLYWQEGLAAPERRIRWIIMGDHDAIYENFTGDPQKMVKLNKYFDRVYVVSGLQIFKRNQTT